MFRRCVTAALLVSYLATGSAGVAHVHASQSAEHGARPHVHWDWITRLLRDVSDKSDDGDSHRDDDHHHGHHHDSYCGHEHSHESPVEPRSMPPMHDHDAACIYVANDACVITRAESGNELGWKVADVATFDVVAVGDAAMLASHHEWSNAPPGSHVAGRDLILKLRALRI